MTTRIGSFRLGAVARPHPAKPGAVTFLLLDPECQPAYALDFAFHRVARL
jgi:hypothetical protein